MAATTLLISVVLYHALWKDALRGLFSQFYSK